MTQLDCLGVALPTRGEGASEPAGAVGAVGLDPGVSPITAASPNSTVAFVDPQRARASAHLTFIVADRPVAESLSRPPS